MSTKDKNFEIETLKIKNISIYKVGIVVSKWNNDITENLFIGAKEVLLKNGIFRRKYHKDRCSWEF